MRFLYVLVAFLFFSLFSSRAYSQVQPESASTFLNASREPIRVFPNPAGEVVYVRFESVDVDHVKVTLHNLIGNEVPVETEVVDEHELRLKLKDVTAGYYLIAVKDNESNFIGTYKFVKR